MKTQTEQWADIQGFEGLYRISTLGRVESLRYGKSRILKQGLQSSGHLQVFFSVDAKVRQFTVHRLMAEAFIPNPNNLECVDHINGNPSDNRIENLRWVTKRQNNQNKRVHIERSGYSKFIGVTWSKHCNRWEAQIYNEGKRKHLGRFKEEREAAEAYDKALIELGLEPVNIHRE